jgi:hypothetical protein
MKKAMVLFWTVAALFALACVAPTEEDTGTNRADAGGTDTRVRTDARAGDTGGGGWNVDNYGKACQTATQCPGGDCVEIYTGQYAGGKACFKTCTAVGDCSDFPYDVAGVQCLAVVSGGTKYCIHLGGQNAPCGNAMNAACDSTNAPDYKSCSILWDDGTGLCMRICDPDNMTTCHLQPGGNSCGCKGTGQGCSTTMFWFNATPDGGTPAVDGICAPTSTVGATCGFAETGTLVFCTGNQECNGMTETNPSGTCAIAVDGGPGQ